MLSSSVVSDIYILSPTVIVLHRPVISKLLIIIYKSSTPMLVIPIGYNCILNLHTTEALEKCLEAICSFKFRAALARHGFSSDNLFVEVGRYDSTTM